MSTEPGTVQQTLRHRELLPHSFNPANLLDHE